jgi:hypothetical protein
MQWKKYAHRDDEARRRPRLPFAGDSDGTGDLAYRISPSIAAVEVRRIGGALQEYAFGLDDVRGVTRSIDFEGPWGLVLGGRGRVAGVYGSEKLYDEAGVWERDGAALKLMWEVDARV